MRLKIINIGNSKGIRFPQAILKQYHFTSQINVELKKEGILITPAPEPEPRAGWEAAFKKDNTASIREEEQKWLELPNQFDEEEWQW